MRETLAEEYINNADIISAAEQMRAQLASGCKADAESATSQWLVAVESLSVVKWKMNHAKRDHPNRSPPQSTKDKSFQTKVLESKFTSLKRQWRLQNQTLDAVSELHLRKLMLEAKRLASKSLQRDRRRKQRGEWELIDALKASRRLTEMWRRLACKPSDQTGSGTMEMIEEGVKQVAQTGFPHNELQSNRWEKELQQFWCEPVHVPEEVMQSKELWRLKRGKAAGEDGW